MTTALPLADGPMVRSWLRRIARRNRRDFAGMLSLYALAAVLGLAGPQLLGVLVEAVAEERSVPLTWLAAGFTVALAAQALTRRSGHLRATALGEKLLSTAREEFVEQVLRMPIGTVEAAGTGDLLSRATTDVDRIEYAARYAAPQILTSAITLVITAVAMVLTSPLLATGALVSLPLIVLSTRWYRRRAIPVLERMLWSWGDV